MLIDALGFAGGWRHGGAGIIVCRLTGTTTVVRTRDRAAHDGVGKCVSRFFVTGLVVVSNISIMRVAGVTSVIETILESTVFVVVCIEVLSSPGVPNSGPLDVVIDMARTLDRKSVV